MKIAVLSSHTPSLFWFRMDMMLSFKALGHEVVAIGNEPELAWVEKFSENGIKYIQADISRNGTNPIKDLKTLKSLKSILKQEKPDKLFTYQAKTVIYGGIAANMLGITEVYPLIAGIGSVFLSNDIKSKIIRFILKTEYRFAMRKSPKIFFQNNDDVKVFTDNKIVKKEKTVILNGSGVNLEKFTQKPIPDGSVFLCISRLIKDKGVYEYLKASRIVKGKYTNARFLLVGPYDSNPSALKEEELKPYIDDGIIEYFGEANDVRPYLEMCNVFVLPSYREGTPKTVLEAMATGRAIITTDATGCRETVIDGENGYLVPIKDIDALADAMIDLIETPDKISQMADKGLQLVKQKFDVKIVNNTINTTMKL
ncbi:MAG: glycosyltransferase family 4 protein [Clostridia bacterium]|nr:glycosyltransferase family 4 protein [Clostridia bacterium]